MLLLVISTVLSPVLAAPRTRSPVHELELWVVASKSPKESLDTDPPENIFRLVLGNLLYIC